MTIAVEGRPGRRGVEKQVKLPLSKALEIAIKSLRVRFTRSILTLITIMMAIAFLTYVWANAEWDLPIRSAVNAARGISTPAATSTSRTVWLISLSLLVCLVGISNAMLMSVMERFREIGTMKCLGALDSFIMKLFLLESVLLGTAGTLLGIIVGLIVEMLILFGSYRGAVWGSLPWHTVPLICGVSLVVGILITAAAAMWPALQAARMEPINAMRVDV